MISNLSARSRSFLVPALSAVVAVIAIPHQTILAGPLTPPPGPVTSTPGAEARIALNTTNTPGDATAKFVITQPGSYYLTANLDAGATNGVSAIRIAANDVTIDLNGFVVRGAGSNTAPLILVVGSGAGTNKGNVTIRNGTLRDSGGDGLNALTNSAENIRLYDIVSRSNLGSGFVLTNRSFVQNCTAQNNGNLGFNATSASNCTFINCTADANTNNGIAGGNATVLQGCLSTANGAFGFLIGNSSSATGCVARANVSTEWFISNNCTLLNCTADNAGTSGTSFLINDNCSLTNCSAVGGVGFACYSGGNGGTYISCSASGGVAGFSSGARSSFSNCSAANSTGNGFSIGTASSITNCSSTNNAGFGIIATTGSTVSNCSVYLNGSDGIRVSNGTSVINNTARDNAGFGIICTGGNNRVEGNSATSNTGGGISVLGGCIVVRNYAAGQGADDFFIAGNNAVGQIFDVSAAATTITTGNSFANFKF
jgi:parallel beta-helix repeat protein